eukprot:Nk52_evm2s2657 gene=Nk52_evmTU2s2657
MREKRYAALRSINAQHLRKLPGELCVYKAKDTVFSIDTLSQLPVEYTVELKVGAQVILLKNISSRLVNGSRGTVVGFSEDHHIPIVRFKDSVERCIGEELFTVEDQQGNVLCKRQQIPLKLA